MYEIMGRLVGKVKDKFNDYPVLHRLPAELSSLV